MKKIVLSTCAVCVAAMAGCTATDTVKEKLQSAADLAGKALVAANNANVRERGDGSFEILNASTPEWGANIAVGYCVSHGSDTASVLENAGGYVRFACVTSQQADQNAARQAGQEKAKKPAAKKPRSLTVVGAGDPKIGEGDVLLNTRTIKFENDVRVATVVRNVDDPSLHPSGSGALSYAEQWLFRCGDETGLYAGNKGYAKPYAQGKVVSEDQDIDPATGAKREGDFEKVKDMAVMNALMLACKQPERKAQKILGWTD